jgi:hypothetical protein
MDRFPMDELTGAAAPLGNAVGTRRTPQSCRWGRTTLFLAFPEWLNAWDSPWSCSHPAHTGPLETVETCTTCPDWTPLEGSADRRGLSTGRVES